MEKVVNKITLGGGCFWCIEAVFQRVVGVSNVVSGYCNGFVKDPTYRQVCSGQSGHAEVIQLDYNPKEISYRDLIVIFLHTHDPTTLNQQMYDHGTQYRSIIAYETEEEKNIAKEVIEEVNKSKYYKNPIVTEVVKLDKFYVAENRHQNFYNDNPNNGYCHAIIDPKLRKFFQQFGDKAQKQN